MHASLDASLTCFASHSPIKVPSGGEDDTPTPDDYNSFIKGSVSQRDIFGGFEEAGLSAILCLFIF